MALISCCLELLGSVGVTRARVYMPPRLCEYVIPAIEPDAWEYTGEVKSMIIPSFLDPFSRGSLVKYCRRPVPGRGVALRGRHDDDRDSLATRIS